MWRLKVQRLREGLHPSEVVVAVTTADGVQEKLIVDQRSVDDDTLTVGYPVGRTDSRFLVELPRETLSGAWRVWVSPDMLVNEEALA